MDHIGSKGNYNERWLVTSSKRSWVWWDHFHYPRKSITTRGEARLLHLGGLSPSHGEHGSVSLYRSLGWSPQRWSMGQSPRWGGSGEAESSVAFEAPADEQIENLQDVLVQATRGMADMASGSSGGLDLLGPLSQQSPPLRTASPAMSTAPVRILLPDLGCHLVVVGTAISDVSRPC